MSCAEIKASEGDSAVSGNYWFDSIKPGEIVMAPSNMFVEGTLLKTQKFKISSE